MWVAILGLSLAAAVASLFYLVSRFKKFLFIRKLAGEKKGLLKLFSLLMLLPLVVYGVFDTVNAIIVLLHLAVFWLIADGIAAAVRAFKRRRRKRLKIDLPNDDNTDINQMADEKDDVTITGSPDDSGMKKTDCSTGRKKPYWLGLTVLLITAVYLGIGWYNAHHVSITKYKVNTEKEIGAESLRIVQITDSHVGTTFDGEGFAEHMKTVQDLEPDMVVITGDFVDDGSTKEDLIRSCEALGELKTKYGVYFVYGNHDKGYFNSRDFTAEDIETELSKNNVIILQDESVLVDDLFYVVGRKDASAENERGGDKDGRKAAQELTEGLDKDRFILMLDHQPTDYDNEAAAGADLVLSGHSHGGQLIPLQFIGQYIIRANNRTYGIEKRKETTFIVCSGISDWEIDFKTGCKSEIVVVDVIAK
ncbi:MAG: metallophosphoesterase [Eubacterium sp.]|nr:metallophosphoesterase [Eubacterium sp.]